MQAAGERANVRRIHDRIVRRPRRTCRQSHGRVQGHDSEHHRRLRHGSDPGRRIHDGLDRQAKDEQPQHKVQLDAFWMQAHEVTWDEYRLFMFANQAGEIAHKDELVDAVSRPTRPYVEMSFGMGINGFPAISMTQHAANKYAEWLSAKTGEFYRLPTEAEWEYACRAGAHGDPRAISATMPGMPPTASGKYQKVATKKPNAWGLYDMLGNVMEWTLDQYAPYKAGPQRIHG